MILFYIFWKLSFDRSDRTSAQTKKRKRRKKRSRKRRGSGRGKEKGEREKEDEDTLLEFHSSQLLWWFLAFCAAEWLCSCNALRSMFSVLAFYHVVILIWQALSWEKKGWEEGFFGVSGLLNSHNGDPKHRPQTLSVPMSLSVS